MAAIRVSILDPSGSKKTTVEVPDDVQAQRLVPALTSRMALPLQDFGGHPINYRLSYTREGEDRFIEPEDTLAGTGVNTNDLLRLSADMTAGGGVVPIGGMGSVAREFHLAEEKSQALTDDAKAEPVDWKTVDLFLQRFRPQYRLSLKILAIWRTASIAAVVIGMAQRLPAGSWWVSLVVVMLYGALEAAALFTRLRQVTSLSVALGD